MTQAIGSYPQGRSVIGAYDMIGNVWEFVADQNGSNRIWRGGGWDTSATALSIGSQKQGGMSASQENLGFRCAR